MLTNLIENRGKEFSNLLKIGDYLGRSLRENVELFSVENGRVTYLTESGKVISGNYAFKPSLKLSNLEIEDSSIIEDQDAFDSLTNIKVAKLISNLFEDDYLEAEGSFDSILGLFETKLTYDRIKERLVEKTARFGTQNKIVDSVEFKKLVEIKDKIVSFLKENEKIVNIPEIKNSLKLASVVSKAFNLPKLTIEELKEARSYTVVQVGNHSLYEHLCRQELIAKEILEAKKNFDTTWAHSEKISSLASLIYESNETKVAQTLAEIVVEIPYFALSTKKQLTNLISNSLQLSELDVSNKDIVKYVSKIYEMKKDVRSYVLDLLNEKYGVNINSLTEVPSFSNLLKTETLIFAALGKLAPKNSVIKENLLNFANSLKVKNGTESIDVVMFLNELFNEAGFKKVINETSLMQYLDFNQVADDLGKIGTVLKLIRPMVQGGGGGMPPPEAAPGVGQGLPSKQPQAAPMPGMGGGMPPPMDGGDELPPEGDDADPLGGAPLDAETAASEVEMEGEEGREFGADGDMEGNIPGDEIVEPEEEMGADTLQGMVSTLEDLLNNIKAEIGNVPGMEDSEMDQEGDEFGGEEGDEFEGGEEDGFEPNPSEGDFDGGGEPEGSNEDVPEDDFNEEEPEEKPAPKGKKPPFKK